MIATGAVLTEGTKEFFGAKYDKALETIKAEDVDGVLTDRRLPGMDGVELVRQIKTEHPDLAVVVMTAYGTIESAVEAMRLGAEDYLVKPFAPDELAVVANEDRSNRGIGQPLARLLRARGHVERSRLRHHRIAHVLCHRCHG